MKRLLLSYNNLAIRYKLMLTLLLSMGLPLLFVSLYAWRSTNQLGNAIATQSAQMFEVTLDIQNEARKEAHKSVTEALDTRSREAVETFTGQLAKEIADFLYARDADILQAAINPLTTKDYERFITSRQGVIYEHGLYKPAPDGKSWIPQNQDEVAQAILDENLVDAPLPDNAQGFHFRAREDLGQRVIRPLFLEMSFIDLSGMEKIKVQQGGLLEPGLRNVSVRKNTFLKAETYWQELKSLKIGEIYVSEVIGASVKTDWMGAYTPEEAARRKRPFDPKHSAYAGLENPVGKRFSGIIRFATPVSENGKIVGYVTLALDHRHLWGLLEPIRPTQERYWPIADPASGNYAFLWSAKGRSIGHPRHYFVSGVDPQTGEFSAPRMDEALWHAWQASGKPWHEFEKDAPIFQAPSLSKTPAKAIDESGFLGLDCRYTNFLPQCQGWNSVTQSGGSGSFLIHFDDVWKLTAVSAIPYFTGQYAKTQRGFGYITLGTNIVDFHRQGMESAEKIDNIISEGESLFHTQQDTMKEVIDHYVGNTAFKLFLIAMIVILLMVAFASWVAKRLALRVTDIGAGITRFEQGDLNHRLMIHGKDELAQLARSFNHMADEVQKSFFRMNDARKAAEEASRMKSEFLAKMSHELRTPLNGILGFAELLEYELEEPAAEYARTIRVSGTQLLKVVSDVLDLAKMEAGRMDFSLEIFALKPVLQEVISKQAHAAHAKGLSLVLEEENIPACVFADRLRLSQVLLNITDNAIKFTEKGEVTLRAKVMQKASEKWVQIEVQDTGIGIPKKMQGDLFEKFQQVESFSSRTHQGAGLGLSLSRLLLEHMEGTIAFESQEGEGSLFYIQLKIQPTEGVAHE